MRTPCCLGLACVLLVAALAIGNPFLDCCCKGSAAGAPVAPTAAPIAAPVRWLASDELRALRPAWRLDLRRSLAAARPRLPRVPVAEAADFRPSSGAALPMAAPASFTTAGGAGPEADIGNR